MSKTANFEINDKRIENAWAMFDWANSSYALVITTAIFPTYFNGVVNDEFRFLGLQFTDTSLFSYSISFAYIIVALFLPILSGIADYGGKRMTFMKIFTTIGALSCMSMYFFDHHSELALGLGTFMLAIVGFAGGQIFYNSFLPIIVSEDQYDRVSAKGFTYGYIGSVILLVINLVMIQKPDWFGISDGGEAARISFVMVGLWWIGFAQIPFSRLPKDSKVPFTSDLLGKGFGEIKKVASQVKNLVNTRRFLTSYFFYIAGAMTVIMLASTFAVDVLGFETAELIQVILILQLIGAVGAFLFSKISGKFGNKISLIIILIIWTIVCLVAYFVTTKTQFYGVAVTVGLVMGGVQSMSRSTYSKLIPEGTEDTASFFSFYDVLEKLAIVMGTFSFGFIDQMMGGMRNSILALIFFFAVGLIILLTVKIDRNQPNPSLSAS